jgi:hypothetical protein
MYRKDHIELAKAVRNTANERGLNSEDTSAIASAIADVCEDRTPGSNKFDREMFMAYAMSPVMALPVA